MQTKPQSTRTQQRVLRLMALMLAPFVTAVACIGFGALVLGSLGERLVPALLQDRAGLPSDAVGIPVTGGEAPAPDSVQPPRAQPLRPVPQEETAAYLLLAQEQMDTCYASFGAFVDLEQLVFEDPDLFQDESYRVNAQQAADLFRDDCQALAALPDAPPAYAELDRWLRLSADEAGLAADHFSQALVEGEIGGFATRSMHETVEHLLNFIDYTHNAASVLESLSKRRDL